jgi:hypothetical protein
MADAVAAMATHRAENSRLRRRIVDLEKEVSALLFSMDGDEAKAAKENARADEQYAQQIRRMAAASAEVAAYRLLERITPKTQAGARKALRKATATNRRLGRRLKDARRMLGSAVSAMKIGRTTASFDLDGSLSVVHVVSAQEMVVVDLDALRAFFALAGLSGGGANDGRLQDDQAQQDGSAQGARRSGVVVLP